MLSPLLLTLSVYFTDVLSVRAPRSSRIDDSSVVASLASTNLQLPANISTISSNASSLSSNTLKIGCDARQFGRNLKVKSCRDLFGYLELDTEELVFAQRDSGIPYDIPLPLRTYSNDGVCYLRPRLAKGAVVGHASTEQVARAGSQLLQTCVIERGAGGLAWNIGGDNKVEVELARYNPNVQCDSSSKPGPPWESCTSLFSNMRASDKYRVFGSYGQVGIDVGLPLVLKAQDSKCEVAVQIIGRTSTVSSWYEIWKAVTAIASMCTRWKGKGGNARGLGAHQNIVLRLGDNLAFVAGNADSVTHEVVGRTIDDVSGLE